MSFNHETLQGELRSLKVYEKAFRDTFFAVHSLRVLLAEKADNRESVARITDGLESGLAVADLLTNYVGGRPVEGARHSSLYYTGESGSPEQRHYNPFSNFPFRGALVSLEAVQLPDLQPGTAEICLTVTPYEESPLHTIRKMEPDYRMVEEKTWIPIAGLNFMFSPVWVRPTTEGQLAG